MDVFEKIHELVRHASFDEAIGLMLHGRTGQLQRQFRSDPNHAWYVLGDIFYKKQDFLAAISVFRKSLKTRPDDGQVMWAVGDCYSALGKAKLAERYYRKATSYLPDKIELTYNLGNALFDQGRYEDAVVLYEKIEQSTPDLYQLAQKNKKLALSRIRKNAKRQARKTGPNTINR